MDSGPRVMPLPERRSLLRLSQARRFAAWWLAAWWLAASLLVRPAAADVPASTEDEDAEGESPDSAPSATPSAGSEGAHPDESPPAAPSAGGESPQLKRARQFWDRGVAAYGAGDYERARQMFEQCYRLMPNPTVLRNLSLSEFHAGRYVLAARHISQLFAAPGELEADARTQLEGLLAEAEAHVGRLIVEVDVDGCSIAVDGVSVGRSPLGAAVYVEPGEHEVQIAREGFPDETRRVAAPAGESAVVSISLTQLRRVRSEGVRAAELMGTDRGQSGPADDGIRSAVILASIGGTAAVLLGAGLYFTVSASDQESEADALEETLSLGSTSTCNVSTPFTRECDRFHRAQDDARSDRKWAAGTFIAGGVVATAALTYALWEFASDDETPAAVTPSVAVAPTGASLQLTSRF